MCVLQSSRNLLLKMGFSVNDADADITFKSNDNIQSKIHSKHLQTVSAVLFPGPLSMDPGENVSLPVRDI